MAKKEQNPLPVVHNPAQNILASFAKKFGKESACLMSDIHITVPTLSSGDPSIDRLLNGGLPIGKITELSGLEGTGKTSLALQWCAQAQRANPDKYVAYLDAENSLDNDFAAKKYGVDLTRFVYIPQNADNIAEILLDMLVEISHDPNCALVVLDSVGSLLTAQNRDKSHAEGQRDTLPALLQRTIKKGGYARQPGLCPILLLNQLRVTQGGGPGQDPWYTPGGMATRHGPHLRLRIQRIGQIKEGETVVGFECALRVMKGRTVAARSLAKYAVDYLHGIDSVRSAVDVGEKQGVIQKRGSMYDLFGETYKGKGALYAKLREDRQMLNDLLDNLNPEVVPDEVEEG
jgi:recombination protein RecA